MVTIDVSNACNAAPAAVQITVTEGPNPDAPYEQSFQKPISPDTRYVKTTPIVQSTGKKTCRSYREQLPSIIGNTAPSIVPPEVPPRSSSPKVPINRSHTNPLSSSVSGPIYSDTTTKPVKMSCSLTKEHTYSDNSILRPSLSCEPVVSETCFSDSDCSSSATIVGHDSEPLNPPRVTPRLINSSRILQNSITTRNEAKEFEHTTLPNQDSESSISNSDVITSVSSPSFSTLSASSSAASSFSSSSSKCASNSYASLSSSPSSNSSKQSVSRETGVRELLLSDAAVETSLVYHTRLVSILHIDTLMCLVRTG